MLLTALMVVVGVAHFVMPEVFVRMVPPSLPWPRELVLVSGVVEILLGCGLLIPRTARRAAWGLMAFLVAVLPANVYMAASHLTPEGIEARPMVLWMWLPVQGLIIAGAWSFTRRPALQRHPQARRASGRSMRA